MTNTCRDNCHGDANTPQTAEVHDASHGGFVSEYLVPKMDCPSEEGLIRMRWTVWNLKSYWNSIPSRERCGSFMGTTLTPLRSECAHSAWVRRWKAQRPSPEMTSVEPRRPQNRRHKQKLAFLSGYLPSTASCLSLKSLSAGGRDPLA